MPPGVGATLYRPGRRPEHAVSTHSDAVVAHPVVLALLDRTPPAMRSVFHGRCPDVLLLSVVAAEAEASLAAEGAAPVFGAVLAQMRSLLRDSLLTAVLLREPHDASDGRPIPPCSSCAPALTALGVRSDGPAPR
ncbi:YwqJ-related putative deaminase [Streptomyces sp. MH13]|uniref:YwqJ-related putative deaminase n=1 Tax=unclassified Streptomyces TaxID=2593676 RepID=UPI003CFAEA85